MHKVCCCKGLVNIKMERDKRGGLLLDSVIIFIVMV